MSILSTPARVIPCVRESWDAPAEIRDQRASSEIVRRKQWALLPEFTSLWAKTSGDPRVVIAVLDGPVDRAHPSLLGADLTVAGKRGTGEAIHGAAVRHGTHTASIIFGQHHSPIKGIAPRCRGLLLPIFHAKAGATLESCSQLELALAVSQAVQQGAHIINISGGQFAPSGQAI